VPGSSTDEQGRQPGRGVGVHIEFDEVRTRPRAPSKREFYRGHKRMRIQPGEVYRIQWPYDCHCGERTVRDRRFRGKSTTSTSSSWPLFTENLSDSAARLALPEESHRTASRGAHRQANAAPRSNIKALEDGPKARSKGSLFRSESGRRQGDRGPFFPGKFEARMETARQQTA